jgi:glycosyltransferase involved in cell wall biosynthesis
MLTFRRSPEDVTDVSTVAPARSTPFPGLANPGRRPNAPQMGPASTGLKVSAVIITYNESRNIRRTLAQLRWCDEIVIVDSFSTDNTLEICREFGCSIFFKRFEGYGEQKKFAVSRAKNDWILCIDADEVLSDDLVREIRAAMERPSSYAGYLFPMNLVFLGREFRYGKESDRYFLRLFNRQTGNFNQALVHEKLELEGETTRLHGKMLHYSYANLRQWNEKCERYSSLSAAQAVKKGKKKSVFAVLTALPYYFFRYYFLERNFLNGLEGFYWSVLNAQYHFLKYLKIRESYK